jgi:hypothetical protein
LQLVPGYLSRWLSIDDKETERKSQKAGSTTAALFLLMPRYVKTEIVAPA